MSDASDWTPNFGSLDATPPTWAPKRPVRIALLGDFGAGAGSGRLDTGSDLAARKPKSVEFDSLEDWLGQQDITLRLPIGQNGKPVEVPLADLESFHPDTLFRDVSLFRKLSDLRKRLNTPATFAKAAAEVQALAGGPKRRASRVGRGGRARGATPAPGGKLDDFARLTGRSSAPEAAGGGIEALLRDIVSPFVVAAAAPERQAMLNTVDAATADLMRALLHHADFQHTESLWRGVDFLLRRLETGPMLQVHLIDVSAEELAADLSANDDLSESGLYQLLVAKPGQQKDAGFTYIAGLYNFEATPPHAELLGRMAKVAAAAGAPFITAIDTDAFGTPKKPPHPLVHAAFGELRRLPEASRLALLGPRFLLRHPYGKRSDPISSFAFEEFTASDGLGGMLWGHPALLAVTALAGQNGNTQIADLPFHHYVDADGDSAALPCTERFVGTDLTTQLGRYGIKALQAHKGEPQLRLAGLTALDGQPLAASATGPKLARTGITVGTKPGGAPAAAPGRSKAAAAASDDSDSSDGSSSDDSGSSSGGDDDLNALLASLGGSDDSSTSSDDSASSSDDSSSSDDADMDPELAALLKSLG
jgi:type VI secretion system protein ImpC